MNSRFVDNLVAIVAVVIVGGIPLVNPEVMRQPARPSVMPFWAVALLVFLSVFVIFLLRAFGNRFGNTGDLSE